MWIRENKEERMDQVRMPPFARINVHAELGRIEAEERERQAEREKQQAVPPAASALALLKSVYGNPSVPLQVRMRAAIEALPFECPKLSATAFVPVRDFAAILEERIKHQKAVEAQGPRVIEGRANP